MAVRLVVNFKAKPGFGSKFTEAFLPIMLEVRQEPGCEQYHLFQATEDPDSLILVERWVDQPSLDAHSAAMRARGSITGDFMAEPANVERYEGD